MYTLSFFRIFSFLCLSLPLSLSLFTHPLPPHPFLLTLFSHHFLAFSLPLRPLPLLFLSCLPLLLSLLLFLISSFLSD
ncbi:hypothetical protein GLOIN_2v98651 [Rhizophagus irregularis DAOM 181602=DAOM 197198]|uniref:Uncharacterized protein n=1 Tax=Rhizophagus irregularis (strain DAOM 181602 / DAOM 197198 / MUCL 43194) TaxID=747089 RepID=A0A2P4PZT0_RHIID|nr:hypothetical protein GLOIN_2v98651 [Rhizophagus irregularis DAOM 181602=DAOM 197198]POG70893.1 hypothetical protein GLOIN_2v98651 [Rhizophagus irregularis DAOM 181602=DAOM 197198]GET53579.1 hypothetical protein GLOIN_2v98651 [Rhizophagus irregularis DAOM 181602=DAOM 197198]|eukprot:XP_025177759.1 hypothetical protein GLOIN_2v98651 [Rhizophagus irregularis DAOM 181602=DAOM 197198]